LNAKVEAGVEVVAVAEVEEVKVKVTLRPTISRSVSPGFEPHVGLVTGY
jgi:hypothetical protein